MQLHYLTTQTTDPEERGDAIRRRYGDFLARSVSRYLEHFSDLGISEEQVHHR